MDTLYSLKARFQYRSTSQPFNHTSHIKSEKGSYREAPLGKKRPKNLKPQMKANKLKQSVARDKPQKGSLKQEIQSNLDPRDNILIKEKLYA